MGDVVVEDRGLKHIDLKHKDLIHIDAISKDLSHINVRHKDLNHIDLISGDLSAELILNVDCVDEITLEVGIVRCCCHLGPHHHELVEYFVFHKNCKEKTNFLLLFQPSLIFLFMVDLV